MSSILEDYEKLHNQIKAVVEQIMALTPEERERLRPSIENLREEILELQLVLRAKMAELGIEESAMNWYPKGR